MEALIRQLQQTRGGLKLGRLGVETSELERRTHRRTVRALH